MLVGVLVRGGLAFIVPIGAILLGDRVGTGWLFSTLLSVIACVYEVMGQVFIFLSSQKPGRSAKSKKKGRPGRMFVLQLLSLYMVQLWSITLDVGFNNSQEHASSGQESSGERPAPSPATAAMPELKVFSPAAVPELDALRPVDSQPAAPELKEASSQVQPAAAANPEQPAASRGAFQLDAPPESLRWTPKTISVVLPCAEERDLAVKTVESVFKTTPADILHEIVVVDDGSNPPLGVTHLNAELRKKYKVTMKRHEETVGLIGAKKTGGDAATGDIVVFFDCHVGPQQDWYKDFLELISQNYRRMVIPQITALDIDTWTQIGGGGGMSKCYVTWDGDFKWGGTDDMYMGMLSGGLLGMSKRWWDETGGYDSEMLGWGGENIDQGIRMWVCGGEIVAAPNSQVAHMWRTGDSKTRARYHHVGDTFRNRARAMYAWAGEFAAKLDHYPTFARRKSQEGDAWYGDMSNFQRVKDRLQGCRPFAWYLRRFKAVYEDAGIIPPEVFMIKEERSGKCLFFQGQAGTSGAGQEGVLLQDCDSSNHRFFWHLGNRNPHTHACCSGLRAWNTDQCLQGGQGGGKAITGICELSGDNSAQNWKLHNGMLRKGSSSCLGVGKGPLPDSLVEASCNTFRIKGGSKFVKHMPDVPLETKLYKKSQEEHPEVFKKLNLELASASVNTQPRACKTKGPCVTFMIADGSKRCLSDDGSLTDERDSCAAMVIDGKTLRLASDDRCLDTWSDANAETWGFYGCHGGGNQQFIKPQSDKFCTLEHPDECLEQHSWPPEAAAPETKAPVPEEKTVVKAGSSTFDLDAPPEALAWQPRTISIVLPCAEERDLAFKTVQSCYKATPEYVLHEIVVVDDGSNPPLSKTHLTPDVQSAYKVKIMRHEHTVGLIGAKKTGGDAATGDIVVFFDCHVAPQKDWYQDFLALISINYRRMVIPQITALDINTWTQVGNGGGMSKCYVTWDGDFKWGGTDDMYMGMLSGGLLGMSKRWWDETGGYDVNMLGWGGENIDQGVRMWVCGGEIVAAPKAQVAHMWRTGDQKTRARYRHVGDVMYNRARAVSAWFGEFSAKLDHYPVFAARKRSGGAGWMGDMSNFQKVKDRLNGCRPFAWYLRRFKVVYEDAGLLPPEIFMIRDEFSKKCLLYQGPAGTSGSGREGVVLADCDENNHRFFWHLGNRDPTTHKCCSGLRAWNTDQCFVGMQGGGRGVTGICELSGGHWDQHWALESGQLRHHRGTSCAGPGKSPNTLIEGPCDSFEKRGGAQFSKQSVREPLETELYKKSQREHPELFRKLDGIPEKEPPPDCRGTIKCMVLLIADGSKRCLADDGSLTKDSGRCAMMQFVDTNLRLAKDERCLDTWSDDSAETWGFYDCHGGSNQDFNKRESTRFCAEDKEDQCFETRSWDWKGDGAR